MSKFKSNKEKGSVLVMAVVLSFALFITGLGFLSSVDYLENSIGQEISNTQALYAAMYINRITNTLVKTGGNYPGSYGSWNAYYGDDVWYRSFVNFGGSIGDDFFYGSARGYKVYAQGRSTFHGSDHMFEDTIGTFEILETFADYLYLTHCEEDPYRNEHIYFWTPDTLDGKVHSNDTMRIHSSYNRPRFMKKTTSCAPYILPFNHQATFDEGFYPNAESIYFPDQAHEIRTRSYRHNFGTWDPDSATELTFDGQNIYVRYCGPFFDDPDTILKCTPEFINLAPHFTVPPAVGALFVHGKLLIKANRAGPDRMDPTFESRGFEGRLTVASSDTMIIYDNLIYKNAAQDNSVPTHINDCLGLISENCIMIGDSVGDTVYINAALASIVGTISVRDIYDYGTCDDPNMNEKQSLFIYGSLAMRNRGLVHTSYGYGCPSPRWGLRGFIEKDYHYDTRFQMDPPPWFIRTRQHNVIYSESGIED